MWYHLMAICIEKNLEFLDITTNTTWAKKRIISVDITVCPASLLMGYENSYFSDKLSLER